MLEVNEYQIIEEIGRGGMATVYKALQPSLGRYVALKVLPPYFAHDEEFLLRFRHEALAVAKLRHPNIVQVYNFHQEGDLFYLAMEYIEGGSLADLLHLERSLPIESAVSIALQIAEALKHAHQKGFIHRDIKPSNILLTSDRQAVLTDFGITKAMDGTRLTKTTSFSGGTSEYISPEQAKGDNVDCRSDLYSLGVVMYETLAGRCPFEGGNPLAVIHSQIYEEPPKPTAFNPDIPAEVEAIILRLLEKDAERRFQDGLDLINAISILDLSASQVKVTGDEKPTLIKSDVESVKTRIKPIETAKTRVKAPSPKIRIKTSANDTMIAGVSTGIAPETIPSPKTDSKLSAKTDKPDKTTVKGSSGKSDTGKPAGKLGETAEKKVAKVRVETAKTEYPKPATKSKLKVAVIEIGPPAKPAGSTAKTETAKAGQDREASESRKPVSNPTLAAPLPVRTQVNRNSLWPRVGVAAVTVAIMAVAASLVWSFVGAHPAFHYQFGSVKTAVGGASVSREINTQTDRGKTSYVVALRVKGGNGEIELRESIPKSLAASAKGLSFNIPPSKVIKNDPVLLWKLKRSKKGTTIIYRTAAPKNLSQEKFDKVVADYAALPRLAAIKINMAGVAISEGQGLVLKAVGIMSDESTATKIALSWQSSDEKLALIDKSGRLTGKKTGKLSVIVISGRFRAAVPVSVLPVLKAILISPGGDTVQAGNTVQFGATAQMSDSSSGPITVIWSSSDDNFGTIDSNGIFSARSAGNVTITARSGVVAASVSLTISAPPAPASRPSAAGRGSSSSGGANKPPATISGPTWNPIPPPPDYVPTPVHPQVGN